MIWPTYIADFEGNGLWPEVTKIWCGVLKDLETRKVFRFYDGPPVDKQYPDTEDYELDALPEFVDKCILVMQNGIAYDRNAIRKCLNIDKPVTQIIDELKLSQMLYPDIKVPEGWKGPPAPHSVEAWGMRFGRKKPEHEDWSRFSPEMLHRCEEDTEIQYLTYCKFLDKMRGMNSD